MPPCLHFCLLLAALYFKEQTILHKYFVGMSKDYDREKQTWTNLLCKSFRPIHNCTMRYWIIPIIMSNTLKYLMSLWSATLHVRSILHHYITISWGNNLKENWVILRNFGRKDIPACTFSCCFNLLGKQKRLSHPS